MDGPMPVRRVTVRFSAGMHYFVEGSARRAQIPLAQYVREATLMRAAWELGLLQGRDPASFAAFAQNLRAVREILAEGPAPESNRGDDLPG